MNLSPRKKRILWYVLGCMFLGFTLLTFLVSIFPTSIVDIEFSEEVQEHRHPIFDWLMKLISIPGQRPYSIIIVCFTSAIFFIYKFKKEAIFILCTLISGVISSTLKLLIDRPRPSEGLVRIIEKAERQSFPSGHVLFYVIFFGFLTVLMYHLRNIPRNLRRGISVFSLFLVFTVPLSRVYLGAHWFTDVTAAFMLGIVCLFFISYLYFKYNDRKT